jgi:polysaccharide biosynthesis protein PslE
MEERAVMNPEGELTLHSLWDDLSAVLSRRKAQVLLVAVTVTVGVYVGLLFVSDQFEAQASLLVKIGRENAEVPLTVAKGSVFPNGVRKEEINSYVVLLSSRPLVEETVQEVGLERFRAQPPFPKNLLGQIKYGLKKAFRWTKEQLDELQILLALKRRLSPDELAYLALERNLKVEREKDADVIRLRLRLPDATLARDVLQVLTRRYLSRHIQVVRGDPSVLSLFEQQAQSYGDSLLALRARGSQLKSTLGVSSATEQKLQQLDMLKAAELGRQDAERERAKTQAEVQALLQRRTALDELQLSGKSLTPTASRRVLQQSLAEFQLERTLALSKYLPNSDPVKKAESKIATIESALENSPWEEENMRTLARNPILTLIETRLVEDEIKAQGLDAVLEKTDLQIDSIKSELKRLDEAEAELQKIQLELNVAESRFLANASRREEARGEELLNRSQFANVALLSPAAFSERPVAPKRLLIMLLGMLAGILTGISLALLLEWCGEVIYTARDLDRIAPGTWLGSFPSGQKPGLGKLWPPANSQGGVP